MRYISCRQKWGIKIKIKFYTSHCPKCRVLKTLMDKKHIGYEEIDDEAIYLPIAYANQILSMPFADVDGIIYDSKQLQDLINSVED